ncbi:MAG: 50S ribosomal protein L2 [Candidatus Paceibacterota bacterium]
MKARVKPHTTTGKPDRNLIKILPKRSGRDNTGKISVRHQGGRHKRYYREIDFMRDKHEKAKVVSIEYDPNRSSHIALVEYAGGEKRYILLPEGLKIGSQIHAGDSSPMALGNAMPISKIPLGTEVHNIEMRVGSGGQLAKSAGSYAVVIAKGKKYADLKLPSREIRRVALSCYATIGRVSNAEHRLQNIGKAGRARWLGRRPTVRGVAQHPGSHPHGGGEGRSGQGMHPKTPFGKPAMGKKTRKSKWSDKLIIQDRRQKR